MLRVWLFVRIRMVCVLFFFLCAVVYACCVGLHVLVCFVCGLLRDVVWCVVCVFVLVCVMSTCVCVLCA